MKRRNEKGGFFYIAPGELGEMCTEELIERVEECRRQTREKREADANNEQANKPRRKRKARK